MSAILVAYFSATGVTAAIARTLAETADADLFDIRPVTPYSRADLDWNDRESRTSLEMNDEKSRPVMAEKVKDMGQYRLIFLGFPIWWYAPPRIINTFLESYNFTGKTMIPFVTSGSSGLGRIPQILEHLCPGAHWLPGRRFAAAADTSEIEAWAREHIDWQS